MRSAIEREKKLPRGIVIRHGEFARERSAFWAYLWSEEAVGDDALGWSHDSRIASHDSRITSREKQ
jgi:hypothetical protein